eukprot:scaffold137477_cov32-Tisochrysis_lutea.AAC.1
MKPEASGGSLGESAGCCAGDQSILERKLEMDPVLAGDWGGGLEDAAGERALRAVQRGGGRRERRQRER